MPPDQRGLIRNDLHMPISSAGYTLSRDLVIDIVGTDWASSYVVGDEDWLVGEWIKDINKLKAIKNVYSEYEEGLPMVRVIRNSTAEGLATKRELASGCWTALEQEQLLNQSTQ
ncbi:3546_t:CDS:2, partial [Racocetra fulgida]